MSKIIGLWILLASGPALCGGRYAGASLELGVGPRAMALAGAAAAMSGHAELFFYNPASLATIDRGSIHLMHAPTFGGFREPLANYNHVGFSFPLPGGGTVAVNWTRFSVDEIPIYPELKGDSFAARNTDMNLRPDGVAVGFFRDIEDAFYFSFAKPLKRRISLGWLFTDLDVEMPFGMNIKLLHQKLHRAKASGMGVDAGAMLRFPLAPLFDYEKLGYFSIGFSCQDMTQTAVIWESKNQDHIRRTYLFGAAYRHEIEFMGAVLNLFWTSRTKYRSDSLFGAEFAIRGLAFRIGHRRAGLSVGAGLRMWRFIFDYAWVATDFENVNRIGLTILL